MKKQIKTKIILNTLLLVSITACICLISMYIYYLVENIKDLSIYTDPWIIKSVKSHVIEQSFYLLFLSINLSTNIAIFIFLNFKDMSFLTSSLFQKWKEGKEKREEEKKAKLQAEIAEKQALLDKLNKE